MPQRKRYEGCVFPDCYYGHKTPCTSREGGRCPENIYELMDNMLEDDVRPDRALLKIV